MTSIRWFFERSLPLVLRSTPGAREGARRRLCVILEGFGSWTVQLGASDPSVRAGDDPSADLVMITSPEVFASLLRGEVAGGPRSIVLDGDRSLLERLINLLSPPAAGVVELRASAENNQKQRTKQW